MIVFIIIYLKKKSPKAFKTPKSLITVTLFSKLVALFLFVILPLSGFWLGMNYQKELMKSMYEDRVTASGDSNQDETNIKAYKMIIKNIGKKSFSENLEVLDSLVMGRILYDSTFRDDNLINIVYVVTSLDFAALSHLSNDDFGVTSVIEVPDVKPYLIDSKYCRVDKDCINKNSFCSVGSYNQYQNYVHGLMIECAGIANVDGYTDLQLKEKTKNCSVNEATKKPMFDAIFSRAKCLENRCVAQDIKISCWDN